MDIHAVAAAGRVTITAPHRYQRDSKAMWGRVRKVRGEVCVLEDYCQASDIYAKRPKLYFAFLFVKFVGLPRCALDHVRSCKIRHVRYLSLIGHISSGMTEHRGTQLDSLSFD